MPEPLQRLKLLTVLLAAFLSACAISDEDKSALPLVLEPARFSELPGWQQDRHEAALVAFERSCARILKRDPNEKFGPDHIGGTYGDWFPACRALQAAVPRENAQAYFEQYFRPYQASYGGRYEKGLFTGYYEAALNGAREKGGPYQYPLHGRPDDLVMVDLGAFREDLKGRRIAGRVQDGRLYPYEERAEIVAGRWPHEEEVLVWTNDPVGSFFLHIQGSGRINLTDGSSMRVGYAGQNGHPYYAIGRELIKREELTKEEVSLQSIRAWLKKNPDQAAEIMNTNKSYVFFRELEGDGPVGGEGLPLTPGRSLAIDRSRMPYGMPVWVDIAPPIETVPALRRLMVAQDTGGAIRGAVRGDVFWGHGPRAEELAGQMKSQGRYWLLLPKNQKRAQGDHNEHKDRRL